jgi:hypothetical protein
MHEYTAGRKDWSRVSRGEGVKNAATAESDRKIAAGIQRSRKIPGFGLRNLGHPGGDRRRPTGESSIARRTPFRMAGVTSA